MNRLFISLLAICLMFSSAALAASPELAELEKRLQQQERRIDRLERTVETLQSQLMDSQHEAPGANGSARGAVDPLVGSWECTNNVFNYDITFFDDGRIIQEEPFFSTARNSRWTRMSDNRFVTEQGFSFDTDFHSENDLTVTNMTSQSVWNCSRTR